MPLRLPLRLSFLLAPGVMLLVAATQFTLVRTHGLTPWKGGGFGMFSTSDGTAARTLRVVLETPEGNAVVMEPELGVLRLRVLNFPTDGVLRDIAERAAAESWRVYGPAEIAAMEYALPDEYHRQILRAEAAFRQREGSAAAAPPELGRLAIQEARSPADFPGRAVPVRAVRAEVWRLAYDPGAQGPVAGIVHGVTVPVP